MSLATRVPGTEEVGWWKGVHGDTSADCSSSIHARFVDLARRLGGCSLLRTIMRVGESSDGAGSGCGGRPGFRKDCECVEKIGGKVVVMVRRVEAWEACSYER